jgi:O-antigen ligase
MKLPALPFSLKNLLLVSILLVPVSIRFSIYVYLIWFLLLPFNKDNENPLKSDLKSWLFVSLLFIIWQCFGFLFTTNTANGLFNLQQKMALLIVPLGIASVKRESLPRFSEITWFLSAGLAIYTSKHLYNAIQVVAATSDINALNYTRLSPDVHPTYASAYLCLGVVMLLFHFQEIKSWKTKVIALVAILLFCSFLFLLQSKAGLITSLICLIGAIAWLLKQKVLRISGLFIILLIALTIGLTQHFLLSRNSDRFVQAVENIQSTKNEKPTQPVGESSNVRLQVWQIAYNIALRSFIGTGAGDVNDDLINAYKENNLDYAFEKRLNTHNQYFQIWIGCGYIGLLLFLIWLSMPIVKAFKTRNIPVLLLMLMLIIHFLTESMFESQAGLNFFPMMISLLLLIPSPINRQVEATKP